MKYETRDDGLYCEGKRIEAPAAAELGDAELAEAVGGQKYPFPLPPYQYVPCIYCRGEDLELSFMKGAMVFTCNSCGQKTYWYNSHFYKEPPK